MLISLPTALPTALTTECLLDADWMLIGCQGNADWRLQPDVFANSRPHVVFPSLQALASLRSRRGLEMSDRVSMIAKDLERCVDAELGALSILAT